ncbi:MAG: Y-family DNA polymerase, partial [Muribaculaceae bacterium]
LTSYLLPLTSYLIMIALVDCNSFFCSVEKVFHPGLNGKPVCVLSSNDGCIVALTPEAKALGLTRGTPIFKVRDIVDAHHVHIFSGNMPLYAAMSRRVTSILRKSVAHVENYSIDESFCYLDGYNRIESPENFMRSVALRVKRFTDIPVSIGIAPSKNLAKIGSKFAKKYPGYHSVCVIDTDAKRRTALSLSKLDDIWGIGRSTLAKLSYLGVQSPLAFADKPEHWVRSNFHLPGVRTWLELNGHPCIDTSEILRRQTIRTSRSFGNMIPDIATLSESVAHFAASCANTLRGQNTLARTVSVFIMSNHFRNDLQQHVGFDSLQLPVATADTMEITAAAIKILNRLFRPGILYKKAGVELTDISSATPHQLHLFDNIANRPERASLMSTIDSLNHRYGSRSLRLAIEGEANSPWRVKCEHRSQNYLTNINEILTVHI